MLRGGLGNLGLFLKCNAQVIFLTLAFFAASVLAVESIPPASSMPWWGWPLGLFVTCFLLGIVAVPSGVGGGVLTYRSSAAFSLSSRLCARRRAAGRAWPAPWWPETAADLVVIGRQRYRRFPFGKAGNMRDIVGSTDVPTLIVPQS